MDVYICVWMYIHARINTHLFLFRSCPLPLYPLSATPFLSLELSLARSISCCLVFLLSRSLAPTLPRPFAPSLPHPLAPSIPGSLAPSLPSSLALSLALSWWMYIHACINALLSSLALALCLSTPSLQLPFSHSNPHLLAPSLAVSFFCSLGV